MAAVAAVAAALAAATAAIISSIALRTASDAQLPWAISAARSLSYRLDSWWGRGSTTLCSYLSACSRAMSAAVRSSGAVVWTSA